MTPPVWFMPAANTGDFVTLFTNPEQWPNARNRITAIQFDQVNHLLTFAQSGLPAPLPPPSLQDMINAGAFSFCTAHGIEIAMSGDVVHGNSFNQVARGDRSVLAMQNVAANGGSVKWIQMDEPMAQAIQGGNPVTVGGGTTGMTQVAQAVVQWVNEVRLTFPNVIIGDTEPFFAANGTTSATLYTGPWCQAWLQALIDNGFTPAFFDLDTYAPHIAAGISNGQLASLITFCQNHGIAVGSYLTQDLDHTDAVYYTDTLANIQTLFNGIGWTFRTLFASYQQGSSPPAQTVPTNLPETAANTHTKLINDGMSILTSTTFAWNFGDSAVAGGGTSTLQNPTWTYAAPGSKTVTFNKTKNGLVYTAVAHTVVVSATLPPVASFGSTQDGFSFRVQLFDLSTGTPTSWLWSILGIGTIATIATPVYVFPAPGVYQVTLTVGNAGGSNSITLPVTVTRVTPDPAPPRPNRFLWA